MLRMTTVTGLTLALGACLWLAVVTGSPAATGHTVKKHTAKKHTAGKRAAKKHAAKPAPAQPAVKPAPPAAAETTKTEETTTKEETTKTEETTKPAADSAALVAKGQSLSASLRCNTCHGADLAGKANFSPSLRASGVLGRYNAQTWARVLDTGVTADGGQVGAPMPVYHLSADDSAALSAYLHTLP